MIITRLHQLRVATLSERARLANASRSRKIVYRLGKGGFDPRNPFPNGECDCSGFAAYILGLSRYQGVKNKPWSAQIPWIETTAIFADARGKQLLFVECSQPFSGCLVVIPDKKVNVAGRGIVWRQGHVGVIGPDATFAIDCATGRQSDAIGLRPVRWWLKRGGIVVTLKQDVVNP